MKQSLKIISAVTVIATSILVGMTVIEPMRAHGQTKGEILLFQKGERDPFLLPQGVRLLSKSDAALLAKGTLSAPETKPIDIPPPPLTVKAVLISDHVRLASIDRYIVTVGDSVGDEKVLEIRNDGVVLGKGDKRRTLLLSQSPIRLTVEEGQGEKR
jgi:hypothetical protein